MTAIWRLRAAVLTLVGVLALHHGRYAFATPEHEHELSAAHGYLAWLTPVAAALLFLAAAQLAAHIGREPGHALPAARTLWVLATTTLLAVFGVQESLEVLLSHGHLPAPADLLGAGGWTALPLAVAAGAGIALLLRGAARAVRWAIARRRRRSLRAPLALSVPHSPAFRPRGSVLARRLAGRAPPAPAGA